MMAGLLAQVDLPAEEPATGLAALLSSPLLWASVLFAIGLWLSLPRRSYRGRTLGHLITICGVGIIAWQLPSLAAWLDRGLFSCLAVLTILSCVGAVTARNPVYCAIWFGLALLGTAGLFLLQGAQFLSVATITVYAGAILVTFLFVIMLAQPRGHAYYDRMSWEAFLSAAAGAVLVGLLTAAIERGIGPLREGVAPVAAVAPIDREDAGLHGVLAAEHVAHLGQELLGRHLIAIQAAGALMLAALVGAVAIIAHGRQSGSAAVELAQRPLVRTGSDAAVVLPQQAGPQRPRETAGGIHA